MLDKIKTDLTLAQLEKNELKVSTLRLLLSEIHNSQITLRQNSRQEKELSDDEIISVIQKEIKKRKEAVQSFVSGNRLELAEKEKSEAKILEKYLPAQLSDEELTKMIEDTITRVGAISLSDMGKVIGAVMGKVAGRADGGRISALVKEKLAK